MESVRHCACKGIRSCLICEKERQVARRDAVADLKQCRNYVYCPDCDKAWPGWEMRSYEQHPDHYGEPIEFPGTFIKLNFLNQDESKSLIRDLDSLPWEASQSGRRKQNFGPKTNFKRRRLRLGSFHGFPKSTEFVQRRFHDFVELKDFRTVEQCSLEYDPRCGASIDPHIDDCWIWGERIVTVNVLGDSVLTMQPYHGDRRRYNLDCVDGLKSEAAPEQDLVVRLPMPEGSLNIDLKYEWEHSVLREDISSRRVCLAYREFTPPYLPDDKGNCNEESWAVLRKAMLFW
ncbi:PREDICTED: alpha-ketoglutarate-dependent dioxygenase alkB homolog 4 [Ceratosolen solmsi marchali]|uniref:Alpha-ketoglutarate-dependent dioxygenase alkB homolog 4 n=1 Tax=Ceratosolen solmsi marchali TaxID=326594 RepID=A0AAJ6VNN1_9HYME|nr:PREDICTED: alpha-ketoglutarate-dependent dioxygenase alkB homolog 4 [Ceratosolen solmsi marchali]